jgi:hypothetical protein
MQVKFDVLLCDSNARHHLLMKFHLATLLPTRHDKLSAAVAAGMTNAEKSAKPDRQTKD